MKKEIFRHQRYKAISRTMENHSGAFTEKPDVESARVAFGTNNEQIGEILSQLLKPVSTVTSPKIDIQQRTRVMLSRMIGIGITLATARDNQPLFAMLRQYDQLSKKCTAYQLYEISQHVSSELRALQDVAAGNGLTPEKMAAFDAQVQEYAETLEMTDFKLIDRRKSRQDLKDLFKTNNRLLNLQLDTFVRFAADEHPELHSDYMFLRRRRRKRRRTTSVDPQTAELGITVTDVSTGLPIEGATINLLEHESAYLTDADGYCLLEELAPGDYTFSCHASGYEVPANLLLTLAAGDSTEQEFALTPLATAEDSGQ